MSTELRVSIVYKGERCEGTFVIQGNTVKLTSDYGDGAMLISTMTPLMTAKFLLDGKVCESFASIRLGK